MAYMPGGPSVQGQTLDMTVVGCFNLKDTEWFSRQDPYVVLEYSGQKFRTRTDTDGGKNPSFNETFRIALIEGLREINATVWNSNTIERDSYIGSTKILLNKVIETGYDDTQWPLTDVKTRKSSGVLKLILHYAGAKNRLGSSYPQAAPQAPGYYGQQPTAYRPGAPAYGPAGYPPQQAAPYPPPAAGYFPSQAPAQPYGYQGAAPSMAYPPTSGAYGPPPPPVQPSYYNSASIPPAYGGASATPYSTYPPSGYSPSGYAPSGYPQNRQ